MLWRESYSPIVSRTPVATMFREETFPLIGSKSLQAGREVEVWWRLFEEDFAGTVIEVLPEELRSQAEQVRPPSRHDRIRFVSKDPEIAGELEDHRAYCAVIQAGIARMVVIGPPTEEVWEEVSSLWQSFRT